MVSTTAAIFFVCGNLRQFYHHPAALMTSTWDHVYYKMWSSQLILATTTIYVFFFRGCPSHKCQCEQQLTTAAMKKWEKMLTCVTCPRAYCSWVYQRYFITLQIRNSAYFFPYRPFRTFFVNREYRRCVYYCEEVPGTKIWSNLSKRYTLIQCAYCIAVWS